MPEPNYNADWINGVKIVQNENHVDDDTVRRLKISYSVDKPGCVEYSSYVITRPNEGCGPLAVFTDIQGAIDFIVGDFAYVTSDIAGLVLERHTFEFWRCRYTPSIEDVMYYRRDNDYATLVSMDLDDVCSHAARLADAVMITEQIHVAWDVARNTFVPIDAPTA